MLKKIKLKWKIFGYILLFSAIIISIIVIFQILMLEKVYKSTKTADVKDLTLEVADIILENNSDLDVILNNKATEEDTSIYIINDTIKEFYGVKSKYFDELVTYYNEIKERQGNADNAFYISFENTIKEVPGPAVYSSGENLKLSTDSHLLCGKFIHYLDSVKLVIIDSRLTPVEPVKATLKKQLIYISIIIACLSIGVAFLIANNVSKPLQKMTDSATKLAEGERNIIFNAKGFKEITELNNTLNYAVEELNKTDTLQRELLANISHDLKTPLTLISGYAEMMKDMKEEITDENLELIISETNRLNVLVNDLLNLSRLQAKTEIFNLEKINLSNLVSSIVTKEQMFRQKDNFIIEFNNIDDIYIIADYKKIEQVVYNFLTNAINYSGNSKKVIVNFVKLDNHIRVEFTDFGIGIKEEDRDLIWNRYYRVDKTLQRSTKGTGLGLAICKEILEYHHFNYGVNSKLNEGSTFYFECPIINELE